MSTNLLVNKDILERARALVIEMSYRAKSAHLGSSLSCVDLCCYFLSLKKDKKVSKFILSKGHAAMALYAAANTLGLLEDGHIENYFKDNTLLWGHPSFKKEFGAFIDWSTGSLGHGLPVSTGFAYGYKVKGLSNKIICLASDGELNEGSNWESILFAGHHCLTGLILVIDYNKIQSFGIVSEVLGLEPLVDKFKSFGWEVYQADGHNIDEVSEIFNKEQNGPKVIICHTIKGKGVPRLENTVLSHYQPAQSGDLLQRRFK